MKKSGNKRSLESFKVFPYLAWTVIAGFGFLVYHISVELRTVTQDLSTQSEFIETQAKKSPEQIENFNPPSSTTES